MKKRASLFYAQLGLTVLLSSYLIVPIIISVLAAFTTNFMDGISSGVTLRWIIKVWDLYRDTIFRSIYIALTCLTINLIIGVPVSYYMVIKRRKKIIRILEELLVMPLAIPGLAIALGIILAYGQYNEFRMSWLFILAGHVVFTLPFMIRSVIANMTSINIKELDEGAASLGAGFFKRFMQIIVPNAVPGILSGALMVFTLSIGEFNLTWMLHTPFTKTLPVGLADSYASMRLEIGSAYTIVFFVMIVPLLIAMQYAAKYRRKKESEKA